jgi:hypothetical protein
MFDGGLDQLAAMFLWHVQMIVLCVLFTRSANFSAAKIRLLKLLFVVDAFALFKMCSKEMLYPAVVLASMIMLFQFLGWAHSSVDESPTPDVPVAAAPEKQPAAEDGAQNIPQE